MTKDFQGSLAIDDLDIEILKMCVDEKRQEIGKHLITACGARPDMTVIIIIILVYSYYFTFNTVLLILSVWIQVWI